MDDGPKTHRNKALSGDLQNVHDSISNFSDLDEELIVHKEKTEITLIEKFINEIGYKH
jgi:hypothetical protein